MNLKHRSFKVFLVLVINSTIAWSQAQDAKGRGLCAGPATLPLIPNILLNSVRSFAHKRGAIVQIEWLVARQSNSDMKNLTLVRKRHPEYKKQNQKYGRVRGSFQILSSGNF